MCIRDRSKRDRWARLRFVIIGSLLAAPPESGALHSALALLCLLYTSDAADERSSVDLGGRRIIKKKNAEDVYGVEARIVILHTGR